MLPITGYTDRLSVAPGETLEVKVSSVLETPYEARLVRVRCGDPNPAGPGIREQPVEADFAGTYPSRSQPVALGSYARVADAAALDGVTSFTVAATVWPTTPEQGEQGIVSRLDADGRGFALALGPQGASARVGAAELTVGKALRPRAWYRLWASYDAAHGRLAVGQAPLEMAHGVDEAGEAVLDSVPRARRSRPHPCSSRP